MGEEDDPATKYVKRTQEPEEPKKQVDYKQVSLLGLAFVVVAGLIWWIVFNLVR